MKFSQVVKFSQMHGGNPQFFPGFMGNVPAFSGMGERDFSRGNPGVYGAWEHLGQDMYRDLLVGCRACRDISLGLCLVVDQELLQEVWLHILDLLLVDQGIHS